MSLLDDLLDDFDAALEWPFEDDDEDRTPVTPGPATA
jgi:hypothetical protein